MTGTSAPQTPEIWLLTGEFERELASGLRQERWAQAALGAGARVRVMNLRGAFGFVSSLFTSRDEVARFRRRDSARTAKPSIREGAFVPLLRRMKHTLLVDLYYPSVMRLAVHVLLRLARTSEPVAIMASSPPFSLAIVGAIAKRLWRRRVYLVVDMRDAWAMHSYLMGSRTIRRALERWVLRCADQVLTVSQGLCDEFAATHGVRVGLVYNVATHYFDDGANRAGLDWKSLNPAIDADAIKLVYTGSTPEGFYDLAGAADALAEIATQANLPRRLQLVLAGACQGLTEELRKRHLAPQQFVFIGHQPHSVARALQSECDVLVFFAHKAPGNAGVVSTKFFEYLGTGRPILSIGVDEGSDVDQLLTTLCGTTMRLRSSQSIADALRRVASEGVGHLPRLNDEPGLRRLYGAYGAVIERLLTRAGAA